MMLRLGAPTVARPATQREGRSGGSVIRGLSGADRFTAEGRLGTARNGHKAVRLRDGRILIVGGDGPGSVLITGGYGLHSFARSNAWIYRP